jgi:hypothetical protein
VVVDVFNPHALPELSVDSQTDGLIDWLLHRQYIKRDEGLRCWFGEFQDRSFSFSFSFPLVFISTLDPFTNRIHVLETGLQK